MGGPLNPWPGASMARMRLVRDWRRAIVRAKTAADELIPWRKTIVGRSDGLSGLSCWAAGFWAS